MLKTFKIFNSRTNFLVLNNINNNKNKLFKKANIFNFSSSHNDESHDVHGGHHHEEPKDYHDLKFDRVSYNQKLSKEQRKQ